MKYIDADRLKAEIEREYRSIENATGDYAEGRRAELENISKFITSLQQEQPSLSSDLDEAANTFNREDAARMWDYEGKTEGEIVEAAFKAGAEWMAGQGVTREVEVKEDAGGYPYIDKHFELYDYDKDEPLFKAGDKVVVQIRKK